MSRKPVKLQIKNFKSKPALPKDFEQEAWKKLQSAIHAIYASEPVTHSLEGLYKTVEQLCAHKFDEKLYRQLDGECERHGRNTLQKLLNASEESESFLAAMEHGWGAYCEQQKFIRSIFLYLDRTYVLQTKSARSIWDLGLHYFGNIVLGDSHIRTRLLRALLALIGAEREGSICDHSLLRGVLRMMETLGLYEEIFEGPFLEDSREFYKREGIANIHTMEPTEYLSHCTRRLHEENERLELYLARGTEAALISLTEEQLVSVHAETIATKGFDEMMAESRIPHLSKLYDLLHRVSRLPLLAARWQAYIAEQGNAIANREDNSDTMVSEVLDFKRKCDAILEEAMKGNPSFKDAMNSAFETFMNVRTTKPPELLAKFVDRQLRSGNRSCTEEELDRLLGNVMTLFRYVKGKDIFQAFYRKDLAKRLLLGKSASIDLERVMIQKLKEECGPQFVTKYEGMFKDVDLSKELMASFKKSKAGSEIPRDVDLSVNVLTTTFWPPYAPVDVQLPPEMLRYQQIFEAYYLGKHRGRRLSFEHVLGHCILKADFPKGKKEVSVSLFQAVVLMLFNYDTELVFTDIKERTKIDDKELRRTLQSLACGKQNKLLLKSPKGREVKDTDVFVVNEGFSSKLYRLKVNSIQSKETAEEQKKTHEDVRTDRQYQIDAAIVRIMKSRKTLKHALLMAELLSIMKFQVETSVAKKRIESLIEREYLERDPKDRSQYVYLA